MDIYVWGESSPCTRVEDLEILRCFTDALDLVAIVYLL